MTINMSILVGLLLNSSLGTGSFSHLIPAELTCVKVVVVTGAGLGNRGVDLQVPGGGVGLQLRAWDQEVVC